MNNMEASNEAIAVQNELAKYARESGMAKTLDELGYTLTISIAHKEAGTDE